MKRLIAALIALVMLLSGCGVIRESGQTGKPLPVGELEQTEGEFAGRVEKSPVYFWHPESDTLAAETRLMHIDQDRNPAEVAIEMLLEGPEDEEKLTPVATGDMRLDFIEYSNGVVNVYLLYPGYAIPDRDRFVLELAIANTITDILGASYTSVYYNGTNVGFYGFPSAPRKKHTGRIECHQPQP